MYLFYCFVNRTIMPPLTTVHLDGSEQELDPTYLCFLQTVDAHFKKTREDYIAVGPYGSYAKGYAISTSDFDLQFIGGQGTEEDEKNIRSEINKIAFDFNNSASVLFCGNRYFYEANLNSPTGGCFHVLGNLVHPFLGKEDILGQLRSLARKRHQTQKKIDFEKVRIEIILATHYLVQDTLGVTMNPSGLSTVSFQSTLQKIKERGFLNKSLPSLVYDYAHVWLEKIRIMLGDK